MLWTDFAYMFMTVIAVLLINWTFHNYKISCFILSNALTLNSTPTYIILPPLLLFVYICPAHPFIFNLSLFVLSALQLHLTSELLEYPFIFS